MQVHDVFTACALVQPIDVLRDDLDDVTQAFQSRERVMRRIRSRVGDHRPAEQASRPVSSADGLAPGELLMRDRLLALPVTVGVAITGNARRRAGARAGQDEYSRELANKAGEKVRRMHGLDHCIFAPRSTSSARSAERWQCDSSSQ